VPILRNLTLLQCTCDRNNPAWRNEIIEFPIVLIDARNLSIIDEFRTFVRPVENPNLLPFCTELTKITQSQVRDAPDLPTALKSLHEWMDGNELFNHKFAFVTDGYVEDPPLDFRLGDLSHLRYFFQAVGSSRVFTF
jgi:inhibitor of KinA sporulation pathway (predicted exonuclease)